MNITVYSKIRINNLGMLTLPHFFGPESTSADPAQQLLKSLFVSSPEAKFPDVAKAGHGFTDFRNLLLAGGL
jgi:hypothetical protein